jgi:hypothetical protein
MDEKEKARIRGWFPQEPAPCSSTANLQATQKTGLHKHVMVYGTIFATVLAAVFIILSILEALGLGAHSSYVAGATAAATAAIASVLILRRNQNPDINKRGATQ